jgi:hypothetical protein
MAFTPRGDERTNSNIPEHLAGDMPGYRHGGDGIAAPIVAARVQGYYPVGTQYVDLQVDATGVVQTSAAGGPGGGAVTVADGADVAQGTTTDLSSANTVIGLLKAIKAAITGTLTTTTSWASAQHVIVDTAPTTAVTGPLTDTQLRATPVPISGTVTASGPLTDTQLRNSAVPVSLTSTTVTGTVAVTDNSGSLTVDAPVGTPVFVRLSDGSAAIATLPVSLATLPGTAADGATSPPAVSMAMAGWDGITYQTVTVTPLDGEHMMSVRDPISRRLMEEILLELRVLNENIAATISTKQRFDGPVIAGQEFK